MKIPANRRCCEVGADRGRRGRRSAGRRAAHRFAGLLALRGGRPYASPHASRRSPRSHLACPSLAAGCGGGTASGGDDPASAVPANAAVYVDATVRPEGDLREDALAAAGKVLRTLRPAGQDRRSRRAGCSPSPRSRSSTTSATSKPWLGEKVALWVATTNGAEDFRGAVVAASTDEDAAQAAIDRAVKGSEKSFAKRSYEGFDYQASDKSAVGVVEDFVGRRHRARVQAHRRRDQGRRARRGRPLPQGDRRARRRPARHVLLRRQDAARPGGAPGPRGRAAARAGQAAVPVRQGRPGRRRVPRRRRAARGRRRRRGARGLGRRQPRRDHERRSDAAARRAAGRLVGGARLAEARPDDQGRLPAGGGRARRRGGRAAAALAARDRPPGGRLQLDRRRRRSSRAGPRWTRSRAAR